MAKDNAQCTIHNEQRRYIDVDKFAEKICDFQQIDEDTANKMIFLLRTFPTADVVEVKHGYWKRVSNQKVYWYVCSVCGEEMPRNKYGGWSFPSFCPDCGSKMDGGKAE